MGVKIIEGEELTRADARETALSEDSAWVIWIEIKWKQPSQFSPSQFNLRYLLFEPGTGRIAASGYGSPVRQTCGSTPQLDNSFQEQFRQAGRDIAAQVLMELRNN